VLQLKEAIAALATTFPVNLTELIAHASAGPSIKTDGGVSNEIDTAFMIESLQPFIPVVVNFTL
jgi:hypothetical protein